MREADDVPAEVEQALLGLAVALGDVGGVVDRPVDEDRDVDAGQAVDEVGAGVRLRDERLRLVGQAQTPLLEPGDEPGLQGGVRLGGEPGELLGA